MKHLNKRQRERIARDIRKTVAGRKDGITEDMVAKIERGEDFTASHPVHQRVKAAIRAELERSAR